MHASSRAVTTTTSHSLRAACVIRWVTEKAVLAAATKEAADALTAKSKPAPAVLTFGFVPVAAVQPFDLLSVCVLDVCV